MVLSKQYDTCDNSARRPGPLLFHLVRNDVIIEISERWARRGTMKFEHHRHRFERGFNCLLKSYNFCAGDFPVNPVSSQWA
jgi:hypothetical protein